ncbi:hypothetical protein FJZ53_07195 [Candidatus Woesearchaeota archaeon]|nr:hypothetical protein [Candidatus Woesearchaeota archaeon]
MADVREKKHFHNIFLIGVSLMVLSGFFENRFLLFLGLAVFFLSLGMLIRDRYLRMGEAQEKDITELQKKVKELERKLQQK